MNALGVDVVEHRVKRRCFAAAGWSGDQNDAFGPGDHQLELVELLFVETEIFQRDDAFLPVQNTQNDIFAMNRRLAGDPEIDSAAGNAQTNPAILRGAHFRNVHPGKHLDAHRHGWPVGFVQGANLPQHAVNAVTDAQEVGFRFKVDVGRFAFDRIGQN